MTLSVALYLLDTDAVIDFFKGFPSSVEQIQQLFQQGENLCTCAVVMAEVYAGLNPTEQSQGEEAAVFRDITWSCQASRFVALRIRTPRCATRHDRLPDRGHCP
jgi:predicted nucleic acid-binding protein